MCACESCPLWPHCSCYCFVVITHAPLYFLPRNPLLSPTQPSTFSYRTLAARNTSVTPWTVVLLHRPIYYVENTTAGGVRDTRFSTLETQLNASHVDLVLYGHVHNAFVSKGAIFDSKVVNPVKPGTYAGPVHACIGNAGMGLSGVADQPPVWAEWQVRVCVCVCVWWVGGYAR